MDSKRYSNNKCASYIYKPFVFIFLNISAFSVVQILRLNKNDLQAIKFINVPFDPSIVRLELVQQIVLGIIFSALLFSQLCDKISEDYVFNTAQILLFLVRYTISIIVLKSSLWVLFKISVYIERADRNVITYNSINIYLIYQFSTSTLKYFNHLLNEYLIVN